MGGFVTTFNFAARDAGDFDAAANTTLLFNFQLPGKTFSFLLFELTAASHNALSVA